MSTTKRIPDIYTIISPSVVIDGNLFVTGNSQSIVSTDTAITDHVITLNNGVTTPNLLGANIVVDRGSSANVSLAWNESLAVWQLTNNGTSYANIATSTGGGGAISSVSQDTSPALGGNLNITGHTLYTNVSSGNVQLYANTAGTGGSGIYVTNTQTNNAELVTKTKAVTYSLIFG
jgi:hypothetical protein